MPKTFAEVTAIASLPSPESEPARGVGREFTATVDASWTIVGKPNGGYLLAILARAAVVTGGRPDVVTASAQYLAAADPGPVTIGTELLRAGRSASQVRAWLRQGERSCVQALFTITELPAESKPRWTGGVPNTAMADFDRCTRLPDVTPSGDPAAIMGEVDARLDLPPGGFGSPTGRGELRGWLALPGDEPFDTTSLLYALDALPPATLDIARSGWVPTLELTAYVRARPAPGPIRLLQRASLIEAGRVDEVCWAWDSTGRPVAHATQLASIRLD